MEAKHYFADIVEQMHDITEKAKAYSSDYGYHAELKGSGEMNVYIYNRGCGKGSLLYDETVNIYDDPIGAIVILAKAYGCMLADYAAKKEAEQPEVEFGPLEEVKPNKREAA